LVNHVKSLGRKCKRIPTKQIEKQKVAPQLSKCAALAVERLAPMDGRKRPRKKIKLINWIKSQCGPLLNGAEPIKFYDELKKAKIIRESGADVAYEIRR